MSYGEDIVKFLSQIEENFTDIFQDFLKTCDIKKGDEGGLDSNSKEQKKTKSTISRFVPYKST